MGIRWLLAATFCLAALFPCAAQAAHQTRQTGTLEVVHSDDFRNASTSLRYELHTGSGARLRLRGKVAQDLQTGDRVAVSGDRSGGTLTARSISQLGAEDAPSLAADQGPRKVAVVLLSFTGDSGPDLAQQDARDVVFADTRSANSFYREVSEDRISLTGIDRPDGDVFGPIQMTSTLGSSGCNPIDRVTEAEMTDAASNAGVDLAAYDHVMFVPAKSSCRTSRGGLAQLGGRYTWYSGLVVGALAHEIGHNLGLNHANAWACFRAGVVRATLSDRCYHAEYGDPFDTMGTSEGGVGRHFTTLHALELGIVPPASTRMVSQPGTYTINPAEPPYSGAQALWVRRDAVNAVAGGFAPGYLMVDYRTPNGLFDDFDPSPGAATPIDGVMIRQVGGGFPFDPTTTRPEPGRRGNLLDTHPSENITNPARLGSTFAFEDSRLPVGEAVYDRQTATTIKTLTLSPTSATVAVTFGKDKVKPSPPPNLTATPLSTSRARIDWDPASDQSGIEQYVVTGGKKPLTTVARSIVVGNLSPGRKHTYKVTAFDSAGNKSKVASVTTVAPAGAADKTPPSVPAVAIAPFTLPGVQELWKPYGVNLAIVRSTDNHAVADYVIYRNKRKYATTTINSDRLRLEPGFPALIVFADSAVKREQPYSYSVRAVDYAGNMSASSSTVSITVPCSVQLGCVPPP